MTRLGLVLDRNCGLIVTPPEKGEEAPSEDEPIILDEPIKGGEMPGPPPEEK